MFALTTNNKNKPMNIKEKLTEIEEVDFVKWMTPIILESIKTCPEEDVEYYKTLTFDDYYDSIVVEIWDGNESFGEGISYCCSNALLVTDNNKDYVERLFNIARDDAWKEWCELCEEG